MVATTPAVTFVFTDIEGSTRLWEIEPARMADALARHDQLCRTAVETQGGQIVKMIGDGMHAVFDDPASAVASVLELQRGMAVIASDSGIPFRMRCGLHVGVSQMRDGDYFGSAVNRAARIMDAAHGGQILLSQAVVDLGKGRFPDGTALMHLGRVRLRDLSSPEDVWQLLHADLSRTFPALRSLDSTPNNLPQQLTSFIGRESEIAEIKQLLGRTRLLTLTGAGGCGKTRLSLQVAADLLESYPDGIWLVELAALADPGLVPQRVAAVLGLKEEPGKNLTQTVTEHLTSRRLLLVLDNAEHLLAACAQLADAVLRHCPQISMLVSSREGLRMSGELTYRVPSLSMPDPKQDATPERLSHFESVRLFIERTQSHLLHFAITRDNAPALASICWRLDGIPLAIELAAARVRSMSVEEVNRRLDQRFRLLTGGSRTALPRQQTLRSLIDWSYDLLSETEQAFLSRLSVFTGGWTLEAAEQVCVVTGIETREVLEQVTSLTDKSLVVAEERNAATRYRLLETVRQYARDRLLESGEETQWQRRHLAYFLALAEGAEPELTGADQQVWFDRLEAEHDNMRSALAWSSIVGGDAEHGLRLAAALWWFWYALGYFGEGRSWLAGALAAAPVGQAMAARAKALNGAGRLARQQSDYQAAQTLLEEGLAIQRELGDQRGIAMSLNSVGLVAWDHGDYPTARAMYEESLAIRRELGDRWGIAISLNNLGGVAFDQGDYAAARTLHEESLAIRRELRDRRGINSSLVNMGNVAIAQGDYPVARALFDEGLALSQEVGDRQAIGFALYGLASVASAQGTNDSARKLFKQSLSIRREIGDRMGVAESLEGLAYVAIALGGSGRAARILGCAERLREEIGAPLPLAERSRHRRQVAAARTAIGDDAAFDLGWREGRAMTLDQVVEIASAERDASPMS